VVNSEVVGSAPDPELWRQKKVREPEIRSGRFGAHAAVVAADGGRVDHRAVSRVGRLERGEEGLTQAGTDVVIFKKYFRR
jgi:hypothetical protein